TGRVYHRQVACGGVRMHVRRHAVRREDHGRALRDLALLLDEYGPPALEIPDDVEVVHDLLADIDRRPMGGEKPLNRVHGAIHARAVPARPREKDLPAHDLMVAPAPIRTTGRP